MATELPEISRLEAALFLSREPVSSRRLAQLSDIEDGSRVRVLIRELNRRYAKDGCAFCAVEVAGGFQLRTHPEFAPWLFRLQEVPVEVRLTNAAMETLAIIAYKQPILRVQIEKIRGVQCGDILRQLLEQNLIRITGRSDELGRPFLYGTTKRFLQVFGLVRLEDLPVRS
ncbi:MAG: SMC-Scp complex subunit ScpB [Thermoguttaceae bacterium]|nr:SMC-Scp complex subunit ScpB [Thermoguttaceae bacterium]